MLAIQESGLSARSYSANIAGSSLVREVEQQDASRPVRMSSIDREGVRHRQDRGWHRSPGMRLRTSVGAAGPTSSQGMSLKPWTAATGQVGGRAWVTATRFVSTETSQVLALLETRAQDAVREWHAGRAPRPVLVLDIDETLQSNTPRVLAVVRAWLASEEGQSLRASVRQELERVEARALFGPDDFFRAAGLDLNLPTVREALGKIKAYFAAHFHTAEYAIKDTEIPGAARFVRVMRDLGVFIVYLSGRDETRLGPVTRAALERDGFPLDEADATLILKADFDMPDPEFKTLARDRINALGAVLAGIDNEPGNLSSLARSWPDAMVVHIDTLFSDRPTTPGEGLYQIKGFVA